MSINIAKRAGAMTLPLDPATSRAAKTIASGSGAACGAEVRAFRVAYLTNVYPKVSHSFIRTEIAALERAGFAVDRFTIRRAGDLPQDGEERAEADRTKALLDGNWAGLLAGVARRLVRRPGATLGALFKSIGGLGRMRLGVKELARALAYFAEAAWLAQWLERSGVRHVHVHFGTNPVTVACLAARMAPISYSFTAHGPDEFDAPLAIGLPEKIAGAAFVVGVSSFGRSQLMRWSDPAHWDRIHVVRCSVAPRFLAPPAPDAGARRLVCVARLNAQKGIPLLIDAAARLASQPHFAIDIIGDGEQRDMIERQIARLGLGERVRLLGWRSPDAVLEELASARALVLPSFAEGLPVVLMEALAVGRPVIATAIAGIPELVDAENGWLVPSGSVDALANAMTAALAASPDRLRAMGAVGRARVQDMHDPDKNARLLGELLARLA
jgi:glycosyltransferase involved in cell wall biosynthesis